MNKLFTLLIFVTIIVGCNNSKYENQLTLNLKKQIELREEEGNMYKQNIDLINKIIESYNVLYPNQEFGYNFSYKDIDINKVKKDFPNDYKIIEKLLNELDLTSKQNNKRLDKIKSELIILEEQEKELKNKLKK